MPTYNRGDQTLSVHLNVHRPLGFLDSSLQNPTQDVPANLRRGGWGWGNLSTGLGAQLAWESLYEGSRSLGFDLGVAAAWDPNGQALFQIPLDIRHTWIIRNYPLSAPLGVSIGGVLGRWNDLTKLDPSLGGSAGLYYSLDELWSIGGHLAFRFVPQFYLRGDLPDATRFGFFADLRFGFRYRL